MADSKIRQVGRGGERKGGYPAGDKPVAQMKPPPPAISRPKQSK